MNDPISHVRLHLVCEDISNSMMMSDQLINGIERGLDMMNRIKSMYKPDDQVAPEIVDFIRDYEDAYGVVGWESIEVSISCESAWDVIKNICRSLWGMLLKLWDKIKHCFRWLFNAQYRATVNASKYHQKATMLDSSREHSKTFEEYETPEDGMISPEDLGKLIDSISIMTTTLMEASKLTSADEVDAYVKTSVSAAGLVFKDNRFEDTFGEPNYKDGTYGSLGWDSKALCAITKKFMETARMTVKLKQVEKDLDADVSALKRKLNNLAAEGEECSEVQKELNYKTKLYTVIAAGQQALAERLDLVDGFLDSASQDAEDIYNGTYKLDDDE